jgi:hypothetical protein
MLSNETILTGCLIVAALLLVFYVVMFIKDKKLLEKPQERMTNMGELVNTIQGTIGAEPSRVPNLSVPALRAIAEGDSNLERFSSCGSRYERFESPEGINVDSNVLQEMLLKGNGSGTLV